jgi:hypothetical protein
MKHSKKINLFASLLVFLFIFPAQATLYIPMSRPGSGGMGLCHRASSVAANLIRQGLSAQES